jgi:hypothetical protein
LVSGLAITIDLIAALARLTPAGVMNWNVRLNEQGAAVSLARVTGSSPNLQLGPVIVRN